MGRLAGEFGQAQPRSHRRVRGPVSDRPGFESPAGQVDAEVGQDLQRRWVEGRGQRFAAEAIHGPRRRRPARHRERAASAAVNSTGPAPTTRTSAGADPLPECVIGAVLDRRRPRCTAVRERLRRDWTPLDGTATMPGDLPWSFRGPSPTPSRVTVSDHAHVAGCCRPHPANTARPRSPGSVPPSVLRGRIAAKVPLRQSFWSPVR